MKKKQQKKAITEVKRANDNCRDLILYIIDNVSLKEDEREGLTSVAQHLSNMNVLFKRIEEGIS